jgi:hypothetical protein
VPFTKIIRRGMLLAGLVAAGAGCSGFGHIVPAAMVILEGGTVVVHTQGSRVNGELALRAGGTSAPLTVRFLDGNGNELRAPRYHLGVLSIEPDIADWEQDSQDLFTGMLVAGAAGTTTLLVQWLHGWDHPHKDREWPVTVRVSP